MRANIEAGFQKESAYSQVNLPALKLRSVLTLILRQLTAKIG